MPMPPPYSPEPPFGPSANLELARQTVHPKPEDFEDDRAIVKRLKAMLKAAKVSDRRWRERAEEGMDFYNLQQWRSADKAILEKRKQPAIVIDEVARTVDLVLGLQAQQPLDWLARAVGQNDTDIAQIGTAALKYIHNLNHGRDVFQDAYRDSLTYGVGWVLTGFYIRNSSELDEPVQFKRIDPREITLDPDSREKDLSDARWIDWKRTMSLEALKSAFRELSESLESGAEVKGSYDDMPEEYGIVDEDAVLPPVDMWDTIDWNQAEKGGGDWWGDDPEGREVVVHELWETYEAPALIATKKGGYKFVIDLADPAQAARLAEPDIISFKQGAKISKVRYYVFTGDILIHRDESPYRHGRLPFAPCWHKRDKHGDPVSFVESAKDPQREINHRRSRLLWELISRNVRISSKAMTRLGLTIEDVQEMAAKPDAVWEMEKDDIEFFPHGETGVQQFQLMQDAKRAVVSGAGLTEDLVGNQTTSRSGIAKQVAASQGAVTLRPKEGNLRLCHKLAGELIWQLVQQAHDDEWAIRITDELGADLFHTVNERAIDPMTGQERILNDIRQVKLDIEIDDVAWSPTQKERTTEMLLDLATKIPEPATRMKIMGLAILSADIPKKAEVVQILQELLNPAVPPGPTPRPPVVNYAQAPPDVRAQMEEKAGFQASQLHGIPGLDPTVRIPRPTPPGGPPREGVA